jgi:hypothetical protein|tara:strand:+ start:1292 stop:1996 length:705 start_codon:yes stop_codon:yes gene_type:complete
MKIALCYWGCIRGFKYDFVRQSHENFVINHLRSLGHTVDIFVETYDKDYDDSVESLNPKHLNILSSDEYDLKLKPDIERYVMPNYFRDDAKINLFKCLVSRKNLSLLVDDSYDVCYTIDIGQEVTRHMDSPESIDKNKLYIADQSHNQGCMNRLVAGCVDSTIKFGGWFDYLTTGPVKYSSNHHQDSRGSGVNLHPEVGMKIYLESVNERPIEDGNFLKCYVKRVRSDGTILDD